MTGVLFGFVTVRRQSAGHFPAMTRGHGRGPRAARRALAARRGTGPATGRQPGRQAGRQAGARYHIPDAGSGECRLTSR
jgi:hypothetical protein